MADDMQKQAEIRLEEATQRQEILGRYEGAPAKKVLHKVCSQCLSLEESTITSNRG